MSVVGQEVPLRVAGSNTINRWAINCKSSVDYIRDLVTLRAY